MVRNTVKTGQSLFSAGAVEMQFHLIIVSICLKMCIKIMDHSQFPLSPSPYSS